jgi:hypothetical protein
MKRQMIVFMGGAGSGKGTYAHLLMKKHKFNYIEVGAILRELPKRSEIVQKITRGELLTDNELFPIVSTYTSNIPTYPGGYWAWAFCSEDVKPLSYYDERRGESITKTCKIYNKDYHNARFALPNYLKELL